jgi:hypothetical protein
MYSSYRLGKASTFYFIYFKKKPVTENDHIMVLDHTNDRYEWTFKNNNTQPVEGGWDEIVSKYPELKPYKNLLVNKKLEDSEKKEIEDIRYFSENPTLEKFKSVDYSTQSKFLKSIINLPDNIFEVLDSYLINEFLSIGPNLTTNQANSLTDSQIRRYIKTREQSIDQIGEYLNLNKHDFNIQKIKDRIDEGQKMAYERVANGNFNLSKLFIVRLPDNIPSDVRGNFYCNNNNLTSLEGAPSDVRGNFYCNNNNLTSLEGAPSDVRGGFSCSHNNLTSLEGAPSNVGASFNCSNNNLTSLEGAPSNVRGNFYCNNNNLTSLEGAPSNVGGDFGCNNNNLTSLEGAPSNVGGNFYCNNNNLTSLEGAPSDVRRNFICYNNNLTSLEGAPSNVGEGFVASLQKDGTTFTANEIKTAMEESRIKKAKSMLKENRKLTQIEILENLRDWFAPHVDKKGRKFKGWINCKTGGPCGRKDTSKGSYPACRPTKAQCAKIKGKMYKKKSSARVRWKKKAD